MWDLFQINPIWGWGKQEYIDGPSLATSWPLLKVVMQTLDSFYHSLYYICLRKKKNLRIVTENYVQTLNKQYTEWYVWYDCNYENMFTHI